MRDERMESTEGRSAGQSDALLTVTDLRISVSGAEIVHGASFPLRGARLSPSSANPGRANR